MTLIKIFELALIFLGSALGVAGDFFIKLAGMEGKTDWKYIVIGSAFWLSTVPVWFYMFRHAKLGVLGAIYSLFVMTLLVIIGSSYFKEQLTTSEILGLILAATSISLLWRFQ